MLPRASLVYDVYRAVASSAVFLTVKHKRIVEILSVCNAQIAVVAVADPRSRDAKKGLSPSARAPFFVRTESPNRILSLSTLLSVGFSSLSCARGLLLVISTNVLFPHFRRVTSTTDCARHFQFAPERGRARARASLMSQRDRAFMIRKTDRRGVRRATIRIAI